METTQQEQLKDRPKYDELCNYMWDNIIKPYTDRLEDERWNKNDNN